MPVFDRPTDLRKVRMTDRIVMMANGPSARISEALDGPLARPCRRNEFASDRTYLNCREAVRFVEAAE
ncbi:Nitrate ABC transporter ATP-binding protein (plasmid) [Sinorhizobium fredii CCBAU 25509]|nr:Nitrate ABC transporter ATP-binding protein [Sinorhizobium fredii CCBAU 25509]